MILWSQVDICSLLTQAQVPGSSLVMASEVTILAVATVLR